MNKKIFVGDKLILKTNIDYLIAGELVQVKSIQSDLVWLCGQRGMVQVNPKQLNNKVILIKE